MWFTSCFCGGRLQEDTRLGSDLQPLRVLGRGAAGQVWACRSRTDKTKVVAVKCVAVDAAPWAQQMAQREACTLALLGCSHVNMLKPQQLVLTRDYISLVSQHAGGGTLYDYCQKHRLSEHVAAYFFRQLVSVIQYMHAGNVAYRDVKLDNMLLTDSTPPRLVLCDFGTSKTWDPSGYGPHMHTFLGTPGFMAPQVLNSMFNGATPPHQQQHHHHHSPPAAAPAAASAAASAAAAAGRGATEGSTDTCASGPPRGAGHLARNSYDATKADVWACGAILHYLLLRCLPYGYSEFAHLVSVRESLLTLWQLEQTSWRSSVASKLGRLSPEALDLLDQLLQPDEDARITLAAVRQHPWFMRKLPPMYERALALMERQQAALAAQAAAHPHDGAAWCAAVQQVFALAGSPAALQRLGAEQPPQVVLDLEFAPPLGRDSTSSTTGGGGVSRSSSGALGKDAGAAGVDRGAAALRHMQEVAARLLPEQAPLDRAASLGPAASLGRTISACLGLPAAAGEVGGSGGVAASIAAASDTPGAPGFDAAAAAEFLSSGPVALDWAAGSTAGGLQASSSGTPGATAAAVAEAAQAAELGRFTASASANAQVELVEVHGKAARSLLKCASVPCRAAAMATGGQEVGYTSATPSFELPKAPLPLVRVSAPAAGALEGAAECPATPALVTHRSDASFDMGDSPSLASLAVDTAA